MDRRIGNRFWEARSSSGRKPKYATPATLWKSCTEYFKWAEDNPLWETRVFAYQGEIVSTEVPKMRAMTITGMCTFLDITFQTWTTYRTKKDFSEIATRAEAIIRDQKFAGAAADLLNANIIARDLGLSEKTENEHSFDLSKLSDEEVLAIARTPV